ncbi:MAG: cobalt ECF transporter T component CbiQ [Elainellaceae cyanobacterium]
MNLKIDEYAHLDSLIHRWNPRLKLVGMAALIFAFASAETLKLVLPMVLITAGLFWLSNLPLTFLRHRLHYPGYLLLGIVALLPWLSGETVLWHWGFLSLRLEGLVTVGLIASRFLCILTLALVLLGTMPFLTTVKAMRSLGLPSLLADMTLLSYRYLYEVTDNLTTMRRAMRLRGFGQGQRHDSSARRFAFMPDSRDLDRLASLAGSLFIRSYEQAEHIYKAMRLRGYGRSPATQFNSLHLCPPAPPLSLNHDRVLFVMALAIALLFVLAGWFL